MSNQIDNINMIEVLMEIKENVSSIMTDIANFKEFQKAEKKSIMKEVSDVESHYKKDIQDLENKINHKIASIENNQERLQEDILQLKHQEDKIDAKKWRTVVAFVGTALGGMLLARIPDFILFLVKVNELKN